MTKGQQRACEELVAQGRSPKQCKEELQKRSINGAGGSKNPMGGVYGGRDGDVPNGLAVYQRLKAKQARAGATASIDVGRDLSQWSDANQLPADMSDLRDNQMYAIPMAASDTPAEPAVACIGKTQVLWILQLVHLRKWALHCDGKHKLHNGNWVLITFGTHAVELRKNADCKSNPEGIVHAFRALVFLFSHAHETTETIVFGCKAMETVARMCAAPDVARHACYAVRHVTFCTTSFAPHP